MGKIADISEILLELGLSATVTDEERAIAATALTRAEGAVKRYLGYDPTYQARTEYLPTYQTPTRNREGVWEVDSNSAVLRNLSSGATDLLQLMHLPVRSITSLYLDYDGRSGAVVGAFAASTLKVEGTDFWPNYDLVDSDGAKVCSDGILKSMGQWPTTPGTVKVTYMAGYKDDELHGSDLILDASPILGAVINEAVRRVKRVFAQKKQATGFVTGTIVSESLGDYSYSVDGASASQLMGSGELTPDSKEMLSSFRRMSMDL